MLFDMLAYVMAFSASYTAERFEGSERWSYGFHRLEPVAINAELTLVIAVGGLLVLWSAGTVLTESTSILLQQSPTSPTDLRQQLEDIEGVDTVADLHIWQVCSQLTVGTVRVTGDTDDADSRRAPRERVHELLADHGIDHATVELLDPDQLPSGDRHSH